MPPHWVRRREVGHPELIRSGRRKPPLDEIGGPIRSGVGTRRDHRRAAGLFAQPSIAALCRVRV
jgi:hypothetical protein